MKKLLTNILYNGLYQVLTVLLPLITTPYISRVLGAENIGVYAYYFTIAGVFFKMSQLGVSNYGNRTIASIQNNINTISSRFSEIYYVQLIAALISIFCFFILSFFQDDTQIYLICGLYALSGLFDISWLFFGLEDFKYTALRSTIIKLTSVILIFTFVKDADDLPIYCAISCGSQLVSALALWPMLRKHNVKLVKVDISNLKEHVKPMLILFLPVIGVGLHNYVDKIMLGSMVEKAQLGFYQSAEAVMSVPTCLITALGMVMLPRSCNLLANDEKENAYNFLKLSMLIAVAVASAFCFGMFSVSDDFVLWFYGNGYEECSDLICILMCASFFLTMANIIRTQVLIPTEKDNVFVISIFIGAICNIILNALLISDYGATGASVATVVAEFVIFIIQYIFSGNEWRPILKLSIVTALPFVVFGALMCLTLSVIKVNSTNVFYTLCVRVMIGAIVYLTLSFIYLFVLVKMKTIHFIKN